MRVMQAGNETSGNYSFLIEKKGQMVEYGLPDGCQKKKRDGEKI